MKITSDISEEGAAAAAPLVIKNFELF